MQITQSYSHPSTATVTDDGLRMSVAAELSRPGVRLDARIRDSLGYSRVMLALYSVVSMDARSAQKDHSAYQAWVQERYLEELPGVFGERLARLPGALEQQKQSNARIRELQTQIRPLEASIRGQDYWNSVWKYRQWLWEHDPKLNMLLDPVVSVHPDGVIFEVFSIDESSYGRVTVPTAKLETFGETVFGTTNVDYSKALADEVRRVRSYRPAFLSVEAGGVALATSAGERLEKKIDLPASWVRGFLQVQSASVFPATKLRLSPSTVAETLAALKRAREKFGPRSLRFVLTPGQRPKIVVEPWQLEIVEPVHVYSGDVQEIRIWGRRRLLALDELLPYADCVDVRLLGTGLPSYWSVSLQGHRFDLGLSGWTKNDWSSAARFDLLAATASASDGDVALAAERLERDLKLTPENLAATSDLPRETAAAALQRLCRQGRALYDIADDVYRWRQLLPFAAPEDESDTRSRLAARIVVSGGVAFKKPGEDDDKDDSFGAAPGEDVRRFRASVRGGESKRERKFDVTLDIDADGRVRFANCNCSWHRREKLRKGPCAHILAAAALASREAVGASAKSSGVSATPFVGMTICFTGALTLFTREQAEAIVEQGGGKAVGGVTKATTHLVAGDKAGSKLKKAEELKIPVLTEQQFQAMRGGAA